MAQHWIPRFLNACEVPSRVALVMDSFSLGPEKLGL
jgi:hypothetical protein